MKAIKIETISKPDEIYYIAKGIINPIEIVKRVYTMKTFNDALNDSYTKKLIEDKHFYLCRYSQGKSICEKLLPSIEPEYILAPIVNIGTLKHGYLTVLADDDTYSIIKSYVDAGWKAGMIAKGRSDIDIFNNEKVYRINYLNLLGYELVPPYNQIKIKP